MFHDDTGCAGPELDRRSRLRGSGRVSTSRKATRALPQILEPVTSAHRALVVRDFLENLDSPRALAVWLLFQSKPDHDQLVSLTCRAEDYRNVIDFRAAYAATKFLSKCVGLNTGIDLKAVAIATAEEAEKTCRSTNQRLRAMRSGTVRNPFGSEIFLIQRKIADILGPVPTEICVMEDEGFDPHYEVTGLRLGSTPDVGWSVGRSTSSSGRFLSPLYKYGSRPDVTVSARKYASRLLRDSPHWGSAVLDADGPCSLLPSGLQTVEGNVMLTVPKSAKTDRVICYEPHMNIRLQLSVGRFIRERLLIHGVNLGDQSINQRRAKLGSKTGHLSTIDLRSASDTVALELVWELLPVDWAILLDDLRSKYTLWPDGSTRRNEKFSSMGNGYTFELESLLFYCICSAVSSGVSVYGDDIVLPTENFERAVGLLQFLGFEVNLLKSFSKDSPFRESCGLDAVSGFLVTPVYLRRLPRCREDVIKLHNQIRRWALEEPARADSKWAKLLWKWRRIHPGPVGPRGYGDGHYHVSFEEACPPRSGFQIDGWWFTSYTKVFRDSTLDDGRYGGEIPPGLQQAALCASLGPKRSAVYADLLDRRRFSYKKIRTLCHFVWPEEIWD